MRKRKGGEGGRGRLEFLTPPAPRDTPYGDYESRKGSWRWMDVVEVDRGNLGAGDLMCTKPWCAFQRSVQSITLR